MAEETTAAETQEQTEQTANEVDWQAKYEAMRQHARDWEKQAKANRGAADELEKLKAEQMTEQERLAKRAERAEAELNAIKAERERTEAARRLSDETGVPYELLLFCTDEDAMADFAKKYAEDARVPSAPKAAKGSHIIRGEEKPSSAAVFADIAGQLFK